MNLSDQRSQDLRERVLSAFEPVPYPGHENISKVRGDSQEGDETYAVFSGRNWRDRSTWQAASNHSEALTWFTPEAFHYFLPAFLLACLDEQIATDGCSNALMWVTHFTSVHPRKRKHGLVRAEHTELVRRLSPAQRQVMIDVLDDLIEKQWETEADVWQVRELLSAESRNNS